MKNFIVKHHGEIIINSDFIESKIIEISQMGGYKYELFNYAYKLYKDKPWLYDIYGENLLILKVLRFAFQSRRISVYQFIITLRETPIDTYKLLSNSWVMFPTNLLDVFVYTYEQQVSVKGFFKQKENDQIIYHGVGPVFSKIMLCIWGGNAIEKKEIRTWITDITGFIYHVLKDDKKEDGIKFWEENTINQIELATKS